MNDNNDIPSQLPTDIRTPWLNVLRCLQMHGRQQDRVALISINILVKEDGLPVAWTTPRVLRFEPKGASDQLLEFLKGMIH